MYVLPSYWKIGVITDFISEKKEKKVENMKERGKIREIESKTVKQLQKGV
jgi:hypothetical protein